MSGPTFWAPRAWLDGRWQDAVLLQVDAAGCWARITPGIATPPAQATVLDGPVLPGLIDAHSHAFQRAFAGLAERRDTAVDDFWSWRDRMYAVALRITPAQLRAVAAQLYVELLQGGYTQVCEFHYLHRDRSGHAYDDPATLCWALADAAADAGIGLTVLPTLYARSGFDQPDLRDDQRRFAGDAAWVKRLHDDIRGADRSLLNAGVAVHSLRAADGASIAALLGSLDDADTPVHIHIAEQVREVDDCIAATGKRPIESLCGGLGNGVRLDERWQLVHATHATATEIDQVAASGAGVVLCPSTEANLGDGLCDLPRWLAAGVPLTVGSDSQVTRNWPAELRCLEYGQRLLRRERNVCADPLHHQPSTAARLLQAVLSGQGRSAGLPKWGFVAGARADLLVLCERTPGLLGVPASCTLDALVFAAETPAIREVYVAGRPVVRGGEHFRAAGVADRFIAAMAELWEGAPTASRE